MSSIDTSNIRHQEDEAEKLGVSKLLLMENAGASLSFSIKKILNDLPNKNIVIVGGTGNNGGDAMVCARHLTYYGHDIKFFLLSESKYIKTDEGRTNWNIIKKLPSVKKFEYKPESRNFFFKNLSSSIESTDLIVDGMLGTGVTGKLRTPFSEVTVLVNNSSAIKVSVDIPSGLDHDSGTVIEEVVKSDYTVTFHALKPGLIDNNDFTGKILLFPIGIPSDVVSDSWKSK